MGTQRTCEAGLDGSKVADSNLVSPYLDCGVSHRISCLAFQFPI